MGHTKEYQAEWRAAHPEKSVQYSRKYFLREKYGITPERYQELWDRQKGLCLLCQKPERVKDRMGKVRDYLSVDHNHKTGEVRALLCHHCNAALGHANDDPTLLRDMAFYLEGSL